MNKIAFLFLVIAFTACQMGSTGIPENFDFGKIENNTYINKMFNFELPFYADWHVQSEEELNKLLDVGEELLSISDPEFKRTLEASKINTAYLFAIFKEELGAMVQFNPSLMVLAENTKNFPGIKKGKDYLAESKKLMEQTNIDFDFRSGYARMDIGSIKFDVIVADMNFQGMEITQEILATIMNGFAFGIIISYNNEEDKELLYKMLEDIKM